VSRFVKNSILGALAGSSIMLGTFLSAVIAARVLGVSGSGATAYAVWLVLMIATIVDLGMSPAIVRYMSELRGRQDDDVAERLAGRLLRVLAVPVFIAAGAILASVFLVGDFGRTWLPVTSEPASGLGFEVLGSLMAMYVAAQAFASYNYAYLRGNQDFHTIAKLTVASVALQIAFVGAGSLTFGTIGAVAGYAAGQILPAVALFRLLRRSGPLDITLQKRVGRYARYAWAANVANAFVWSRIEVFFLERYWGNEAVAMFTVALVLTSLAAQGPVLLTTGVLSFLAEKHGRSDVNAMKEAFETGTRLLATLTFPACLGVAAIMPALLPLIYGNAFAPAIPAAIILAGAATIGATSVVATNLVQAVERSDFIFFSSLFGALVAIFAGFLLVPHFGVMGAAVARATIQATMVVVGLCFVARHLGYSLPLSSLARLFLAASVAASIAAASVLTFGGPFSLLIAIPVAILAYIIGLRLTCALPSSDLARLAELVPALPQPLANFASHILHFVNHPCGRERPQEKSS
jgi:O-antigen/teichoic acid export membrane protein